MKIETLKKKLLDENPKFKEEYFKEDLPFGVSRLISNARAYSEIDQKELAKIIKTKQSAISRIESGRHMPSLTFIHKIGLALKCKTQIRFISSKTGTIFDSDGNVRTNTQAWSLTENINNPLKSLATHHTFKVSPFFTRAEINTGQLTT